MRTTVRYGQVAAVVGAALLLVSGCRSDEDSRAAPTDPPVPTVSIVRVVPDSDGGVQAGLRAQLYVYAFIGAPENLDDDYMFCSKSRLSAAQQSATIESTVAERALVEHSQLAYGPDFNTREVRFADGLTGEVTVRTSEGRDGIPCVLRVEIADPAVAERFGVPPS